MSRKAPSTMTENSKYLKGVISDDEVVGETRCPHCHHMFFKGVPAGGSVLEIKCPARWCRKKVKFLFTK